MTITTFSGISWLRGHSFPLKTLLSFYFVVLPCRWKARSPEGRVQLAVVLLRNHGNTRRSKDGYILRLPVLIKCYLNKFYSHNRNDFVLFAFLSDSYMGRAKRILYLSPMRAVKVQASLHIRAVTPEPPLLAHTSSESRGTFRQKVRSLAPLNGWACAVKICHDGMLEDTNSLDTPHIADNATRIWKIWPHEKNAVIIQTFEQCVLQYSNAFTRCRWNGK